MRFRLVLIATFLATAALVVGCASDSDPAPKSSGSASPTSTGSPTGSSSGRPDPCSLLTQAEVSSATGLAFSAGAINETVTQETIAACDWHGPGIDTVQVLVSTVGAFDPSRATAAQVYGAADDITVAGAPRAYLVKGGFLIGMDMGDNFLQVSYISTNPDVTAAVRDLAAKAAGRMA